MAVEALISTQVIDTTTVGRALMTAVDASGARTTLGLGSLATQSGTFSGTSSGTNTGDQTIALTGDVTGTGTGSFAATIGALKVTNAMLAGSIAASKLVGTDIATLGTVTAGTLSTGAVIGGVTVTLGSDATGDIYYRNASGVFNRLGIGSAAQVLTVAGGLPSWAAASGGGDALVANPLSQFAATTSAQLAGVISNETGSGALVFATAPTFGGTITVNGVAVITSQAISDIPVAIAAFASQTANLFETRNSSAAVKARITAAGSFSNTVAAAFSEVFGALAGMNMTGTRNTAVGYAALQTMVAGYDNVAIGQSASNANTSNNNSTTAIGNTAASTAVCSAYTVVGNGAGASRADITGCCLFGDGANTSATGITNTIAIGRFASATATAQFIAGSSSYPASDIYFGKGVTNATPTTWVVNGTGGSGTNISGGSITIAGGRGTGTGLGGSITLQVAAAGVSGSSLNTLVSIITIASTGLISYPTTVTAGGTTGAQTINKISGTVNFAAAATSLLVTNSLVSTTSLVFVVVRTNDATATIKHVVPAAGSFTITLNAAATAETSVGFYVIN